ncbi:MAG: lipoate--protein ligase [Clostridiales bacterium]|nr:lipoate--protein ligase [Clostridiales bacterium]
MKYIKNLSTDPYFNSALEEYCLENISFDEDLFIIWRNESSVILGRHQNVFQEINYKFIQESRIPVVRRISGGGTVYHDLGNINFTFIFTNKKDEYVNYITHNQKIMEVLKLLGIKTRMSDRHDILYNGKKISGNAQRILRKRVLHHGTILFNTDLDILEKSIYIDKKNIYSKAIESVRSQVTNIKEYLNNKMDETEIIEYFYKILSNNYLDNEIILKKNDVENIENLVKEKFSKWEWNYGESPTFNYQNSLKINKNNWHLNLNVKNGIIQKCDVFKNSFMVPHRLVGLKYDIDSFSEFFRIISREEVYKLFFGQ